MDPGVSKPLRLETLVFRDAEVSRHPNWEGFAGNFSSDRELIRYGTLGIGSGEALLIRSGVHRRCSPSSNNLI